jgi:hypothetical protein
VIEMLTNMPEGVAGVRVSDRLARDELEKAEEWAAA